MLDKYIFVNRLISRLTEIIGGAYDAICAYSENIDPTRTEITVCVALFDDEYGNLLLAYADDLHPQYKTSDAHKYPAREYISLKAFEGVESAAQKVIDAANNLYNKYAQA